MVALGPESTRRMTWVSTWRVENNESIISNTIFAGIFNEDTMDELQQVFAGTSVQKACEYFRWRDGHNDPYLLERIKIKWFLHATFNYAHEVVYK